MDTDELDQLLDEFEDVFVKAGENGEQLNMESMMDKMNANNDGTNGTSLFFSVDLTWSFSGKDESGGDRDSDFLKANDGTPPRQFSAEELAPQIMIRKAKKVIFFLKMNIFYTIFRISFQEWYSLLTEEYWNKIHRIFKAILSL